MSKTHWIAKTLLFTSALITVATLRAQVLTGEIDGAVRDPTGATIAHAQVTATNVNQRDMSRTVYSESDGTFHIPLLPVGNYSLTVKMQGFEQDIVARIALHVGDQLNLPLALKIGKVSDSTEVDANGLTVDTENATANTLLTGTEVTELSLATRNVEQLFSLQPGVTSPDPSAIERGSFSSSGANRAYYAVNGQRPTQLALFLDGSDLLDRSSLVADSQINTFPSVESIREITFIRNSYGAQYGSTGSALILETSRSGTDQYHGTAYFFFRNEIFNANNYFNNQAGIPRPTFRYDNYGYSIGGPVVIPGKHSKHSQNTFFFFSQELLREQSSTTNASNVPTLLNREGIVSLCPPAPITCTAVPAGYQINNINPVAQAYLKDVFDKLPPPSTSKTAGSTALESLAPFVHDNNVQLLRIDQKISDTLTAFLRIQNDEHSYSLQDGPGTNNYIPGLTTVNANSFGRDFMVGITKVLSPTMVVQAGYHYNPYGEVLHPSGFLSDAVSPDVQITLPFPTTSGRIPDLWITGITRTNGTSNYDGSNLQQQLFANFTKALGKHNLQFGINLEHIKVNNNGGTVDNNAGTFVFTSFPNFLAGTPSQFTQTSIDQKIAVRQNIAEAYLQDDFRAASRLTLNLGVRYSFLQLPWDDKNRTYAFQPQAFNPAKAPTISTASSGDICTATPCSGGGIPNTAYDPLNGIVSRTTSPYGRYIVRQPYLTFAPRVGFAYNVNGSGTTVLRAGYGIYFQTVQYDPLQANVFNNPPLVDNVTYVSPTFADPALDQPSAANSPLEINGLERNWRAPYLEAWSLDVQQAFPHGFLGDIGYVGNEAKHLVGNLDINQAPSGLYAKDNILPAGKQPTATTDYLINQIRPYKGYESIVMSEPSFRSNYHSLQAQIAKRMKKGAILTVNYTWSKSMTDSDNAAKTTPPDSYNLRQSYGPSSYDRRNVISGALVYFLPFYESQSKVTGHLLGGWELTSVVVLASGPYATASISNSDPGGLGIDFSPNDGDRPNQISDPNIGATHSPFDWFNTAAFVAPPATVDLPGNAGSNTIQQPGLEQVTLGIYKNTDLSEKFRLQLRAESFNLLNHPNFLGLESNLSQSNYGALTSAADPRELQFGAKLIF